MTEKKGSQKTECFICEDDIHLETDRFLAFENEDDKFAVCTDCEKIMDAFDFDPECMAFEHFRLHKWSCESGISPAEHPLAGWLFSALMLLSEFWNHRKRCFRYRHFISIINPTPEDKRKCARKELHESSHDQG